MVFGGPLIIKRLISGYSDGALKPFGVSVSPTLNVSIKRLDFILQNEIDGQRMEGFSRATEIAWSLLGQKPFLEINLGPSVLKGYATVNSVNIYTPSISEIDWQNIFLAAVIDGFAINSFAKTKSVTLAGNLNLDSGELSNFHIEADNFSAAFGSATYSARLIKSSPIELDLNAPVDQQLLSSTYEVKDIKVSELDIIASEAIFEVAVAEGSRNFKMDLKDIKLAEPGGFVDQAQVEGRFDQLNVLQALEIHFSDGYFFNNSVNLSATSVRVKKSADEMYQAHIDGNLGEFELSNSDTFIGSLPSGGFLIDLELDRLASKAISLAKINFNNLNEADVSGFVEVEFNSELFMNLECALLSCEFSNFEVSYQLDLDNEWVRGSVICPRKACNLSDMEHLVRTSSTANVFLILNRTKILSPLMSIYLFGAVNSGQEINGGHQLKFQF